mmetsp:Transcript_14021/g.29595  ORF Transcript_14021/g.29595 Transcript_14021/m.29595 type:complete len:295 (-) Transcript_14021:702-1586(-)
MGASGEIGEDALNLLPELALLLRDEQLDLLEELLMRLVDQSLDHAQRLCGVAGATPVLRRMRVHVAARRLPARRHVRLRLARLAPAPRRLARAQRARQLARRARVVLLLAHLAVEFVEVGADDSNRKREHHQAAEHGDDGDDSSGERDGRHVAVADGRHRDEAPPHRGGNRLEGRLLPVRTHVLLPVLVPLARLAVEDERREDHERHSHEEGEHQQRAGGLAESLHQQNEPLEVPRQFEDAQNAGEAEYAQHRQPLEPRRACYLLDVEGQDGDEVDQVHDLGEKATHAGASGAA